MKETKLYPIVEKWLKREHLCFKTSQTKGTKHFKVDVIGVKDVGGDLSGEVETIAVEVKKGTTPFVNASGQAAGYKVCANRVYLADYGREPFSNDETGIASHLGIGLIKIWKGKCREILSSPYYKPITKLNLTVLENIGLGKCQFCGSFFELGNMERKFSYTYMAREDMKKAVGHEKGLIFWNREVASRKDKLGIRKTEDGTTYERRFICPDCIFHVLSQLKG